MIKIEKLYEATNGGLDIILDIYPQAKDCVGVKNKHFKIRDEKNSFRMSQTSKRNMESHRLRR